MRLVFLLASVTAVMSAGEDDKGYANSFSYGNGQGFGYSGSYGPGPGGSPPPNFPPFNFNNLFAQYFDIFQKFNQQLAATKGSLYAYSITNANSNSRAQASSSITYNKKGLQNQQNAIASGGVNSIPHGYPAQGGAGGLGGGVTNFGGAGGFGGGFTNFGGGGGQGASASASIGPGGGHQSAAVYPENPNNPNVNNRFGEPSGGSSFGVFTSSQSFSSNVDGKPTSYHQASTTINDNGNITTYTVHNP